MQLATLLGCQRSPSRVTKEMRSLHRKDGTGMGLLREGLVKNINLVLTESWKDLTDLGGINTRLNVSY